MFHVFDSSNDGTLDEQEFVDTALHTYKLWEITEIPSTARLRVGFKLGRKGLDRMNRECFLHALEDVLEDK